MEKEVELEIIFELTMYYLKQHFANLNAIERNYADNKLVCMYSKEISQLPTKITIVKEDLPFQKLILYYTLDIDGMQKIKEDTERILYCPSHIGHHYAISTAISFELILHKESNLLRITANKYTL